MLSKQFEQATQNSSSAMNLQYLQDFQLLKSNLSVRETSSNRSLISLHFLLKFLTYWSHALVLPQDDVQHMEIVPHF